MEKITPAKAGVRKQDLEALLDVFKRHCINTHSILMSRGGKLFFEQYWDPFTSDRPHRMYSVTKSFVSIAVGCLYDEGKINLDDPIIQYFPDKLPENVPEELQEQTIRHMLTMCTCFAGINWFKPEVNDRLAYYFAAKPVRPAGTIFDYDSTGSYVLGCLVERVCGMRLLDYLKLKVLNHIGGFENAEMLETPDGTPWGDSALLATPRALMNFARFVMQRGVWEGKRLMSEDYLQQATTKQTDNNLLGGYNYCRFGYGYQIWMTEQGGFAFNGMGGQFAICVPEKDFIFVCTCDNQLNDPFCSPVIFNSVFRCIVDNLCNEELPEETPIALGETKLPVCHGEKNSPFFKQISGCWYACKENPMGISRFSLDFVSEEEGVFTFYNKQGEKKLPFGMKKNIFTLFPQFGYSDQRGNVHEVTDFRYQCAVSAGWVEEKKLQIKVQIIDRYFANLIITIGFRDLDTVGICMNKCAEDFLNEYQGWLGAKRIK